MKKPQTQGKRLLHELFLRGKRVYTMKEIVAAGDVQKVKLKQLKKILSSLTSQEKLLRLKRGLYAIVNTIPEQTHIHPFAIATQLVQPSAISHESALNYHGLLDHPPSTITLITTKKVVTPSMRLKNQEDRMGKHAWEIADLRYEYQTVQRKHFFGIEKIWLDEHDEAYLTVPITNIERTLLDLLISPSSIQNIDNYLNVLTKVLPKIDIKRLVDYALEYNKKSVIKRLGYLLEQLHVSNELLLPLQKVLVNYYCRLDPSLPAKGPCNKHWMIQVNW